MSPRSKRRGVRWWLPLVVPVFVAIVFGIWAIRRDGQVVHSGAAQLAYSWTWTLALLAGPAFYSGYLFKRQHDDG